MAAENAHFGDSLVKGLKNVIADLEDLQVQLALGEAEAKDLYEESKKKLASKVQSAVRTVKEGVKNLDNEALNGFEHLKVQLALGKAETAEQFEAQKKAIFRSVNTLDKRLATVKQKEVEEKLLHEFERFKIKAEMLNLRYTLGEMEAKAEFEKRKRDFSKKLDKLKLKLKEAQNSRAKTRAARREELKEAYKHVKKAFK